MKKLLANRFLNNEASSSAECGSGHDVNDMRIEEWEIVVWGNLKVNMERKYM